MLDVMRVNPPDGVHVRLGRVAHNDASGPRHSSLVHAFTPSLTWFCTLVLRRALVDVAAGRVRARF